MHGVVDGIQAVLLCAGGQLGLASGCAEFALNSPSQVLLGGVGHVRLALAAQKLSELSGMLGLFVSCLFPVQADFGVALAVSDARHAQVHAHFRALAREVRLQLLQNVVLVLVGHVGVILDGFSVNAELVLGGKLHFAFNLLEHFSASAADGALEIGGKLFAFVDVTANFANPFRHDRFSFCLFCFWILVLYCFVRIARDVVAFFLRSARRLRSTRRCRRLLFHARSVTRVRDGRLVGERLGLRDQRRELKVAAQILHGNNFTGNEAAGIRIVQQAVLAAFHAVEQAVCFARWFACEFVHVAARLHAKVPEVLKRRVIGQDGQVERACFLNELGREVLLHATQRDVRRACGGLHGGVHNATVVARAIACGKQVQSVAHGVEGRLINCGADLRVEFRAHEQSSCPVDAVASGAAAVKGAATAAAGESLPAVVASKSPVFADPSPADVAVAAPAPSPSALLPAVSLPKPAA